jgi:hypothetical protein
MGKIYEYIFNDIWYVSWNKDHVFKLFSSRYMKTYFELFILNIKIQELLFGFSIYYTVNDIEEWMIEYDEEEKEGNKCGGGGGNNKKRYDIEKPFGTCSYNDVTVMLRKNNKRNQYYLAVKPNNEKLLRRYSYHIINDNFDMSTLISKFDSNFYNSDGSSGGLSTTGAKIQPNSIFSKLLHDYALLQEYIIHRDDANWSLANPQPIIIPAPLPDVDIKHLSEENYYTSDSIDGAKQAASIKKARIATRENTNILSRLIIDQIGHPDQMSGYNNSSSRKSQNTRVARKNLFSRHDMLEGAWNAPESSNVIIPYAPNVLINLEYETNRYKTSVCSIMGVPIQLVDSDMTNSLKGGGGSKLTSIKENHDEVIKEFRNYIGKIRKRLIECSEDLFNNTFHKMDKLLKKYNKQHQKQLNPELIIEENELDLYIEESNGEDAEGCENNMELVFIESKERPSQDVFKEIEVLTNLLKIGHEPEFIWKKIKVLLDEIYK